MSGKPEIVTLAFTTTVEAILLDHGRYELSPKAPFAAFDGPEHYGWEIPVTVNASAVAETTAPIVWDGTTDTWVAVAEALGDRFAVQKDESRLKIMYVEEEDGGVIAVMAVGETIMVTPGAAAPFVLFPRAARS